MMTLLQTGVHRARHEAMQEYAERRCSQHYYNTNISQRAATLVQHHAVAVHIHWLL